MLSARPEVEKKLWLKKLHRVRSSYLIFVHILYFSIFFPTRAQRESTSRWKIYQLRGLQRFNTRTHTPWGDVGHIELHFSSDHTQMCVWIWQQFHDIKSLQIKTIRARTDQNHWTATNHESQHSHTLSLRWTFLNMWFPLWPDSLSLSLSLSFSLSLSKYNKLLDWIFRPLVRPSFLHFAAYLWV